MTTLGDFDNLALLDKFTNTSTSTGTIDLKTVNNGVDGDELHLYIILSTASIEYLRNFSEELIVISLFEVNLVIDGITNLTLTPFLNTYQTCSKPYLLTSSRL